MIEGYTKSKNSKLKSNIQQTDSAFPNLTTGNNPLDDSQQVIIYNTAGDKTVRRNLCKGLL